MILGAAASPLAGQEGAARNARSSGIDGRGRPLAEKTPTVLREGENLVDRIGAFRIAGERIAFYPSDGGRPIRTLENLALERIAQVLAETSSQRRWRVSGRVTEYRGENYLLVTRALLKSRGEAAAKPPGRAVEPAGRVGSPSTPRRGG